MDDIRDQFPVPPCVQCGRGMCVKNERGKGYLCPSCGQYYEFEIAGAPMIDPKLAALGPMVLSLRLTMAHWRMAMEHAMETLQYEKMAELIEGHKEWLDQIGLPLADYVRKLKHDEQIESLPETNDGDWLGDERLRKIR